MPTVCPTLPPWATLSHGPWGNHGGEISGLHKVSILFQSQNVINNTWGPE